MTNSFQWLTRRVEMPGIDFDKIERWIIRVAREHNRIVGEVAYIFCNDDEILDVNRQFLNHDYYTDIITFDNTHGKLIEGDIFISLDTVATNAVAVGASYDTELLRVIIHGILHLCDINDKGPGEREIMQAHEDQALKIFNEL